MKRLTEYGFVSKPKSSRLAREESIEESESQEDPSPEPVDQEAGPQLPGSPQPPQLPQLVRNDLGTYSSADMRKLSQSDSERLWVLRNTFRPDVTYKYPAKDEYGKKRSFQHAWISQFPYSVASNGGYCFLFAKRFLNLGQLVTSPMTNFTRAKVTLSEHDKQASHKMASEDAVDFINCVDKGGPSIGQLIQNEASASIIRNRLKLRSIQCFVVTK